MIPHTLHLKLTGRREPEWKDSHLVSGVDTPPFLSLGSPAKVRLLLTNTGGTATQSAAGLTDILLEVWRSESMKDGELLIAADAVSVTTAAPTFGNWASQTGDYYTAKATLPAAQTAAALAALLDEATLKAWLEVRATYNGANIRLGAGPVILERGSTGGTPAANGETYLTAAQITALLEGVLRVDSTGIGSLTLTDGDTTYTVPTGGFTE